MKKIEYSVNNNKLRIYVWDMTPEEEADYNAQNQLTPQAEIAECKTKLTETDYKAIKYAEGWYTEEEYAPIKAEREALRERIRELEAET